MMRTLSSSSYSSWTYSFGLAMTPTAFTTLPLRPELLASLAALGYDAMTAIQAEALPAVLGGSDVLAQADTGSGKTAAFGLGLLNALDPQRFRTQALVLCPTRELAEQVCSEIRRLASQLANIKVLSLCGGKPLGPQLASLERDPHIVVGTPGRIQKHLDKQTLKLDAVHTLVLDEADRMLDMGFHDDIMAIIARTPTSRQTLLFSATYPDGIQRISGRVQREPVTIRVSSAADKPDIEQVFIEVNPAMRSEMLYKVIAHYRPESCLVFCNTKQQCAQLATALQARDLHVRSLHGDLEQSERDQVLARFAGKSLSILIATDVAARGLDVKALDAVINFELSPDPEVHIHRIGRTARAGASGIAVSLFTSAEQRRVRAIEDYQGSPATRLDANSLTVPPGFKHYPPMVTLAVNGGRKNKIRPGDLLGALTAHGDIRGEQIGKITLLDTVAYVAVEQAIAKLAVTVLTEGKIKGKSFKARVVR